jgi:hypothetical protein
MQRHTLLSILLLATPLFPWNFGLQLKSIPIPVFSYILSAHTTQQKKTAPLLLCGADHTEDTYHVSDCQVHWTITSIGSGADDVENTVSSIVACWTVFTELLLGNALIKSVTKLSPSVPRFSSDPFPSRFRTNMLHEFHISSVRAIHSVHFIPLDLNTVIIFRKNYKL